MSSLTSDEVIEMYCEPCHADGFKGRKADGFCTECVEYMCATCMRYHRKHLPDHVLQDKHDMPQDFCLELCPSHIGEIIKFYCKTCNDLACSLCKGNLHANCTDVCHISKVAAEFEKSAELKDLNSKIVTTREELESVKGLIKKGEQHADVMKTRVRKDMKKQQKDLITRCEHLEEQINNRISKIHKNDKEALEKQWNEAVEVNKELSALQIDIQNTTKALQRCKLFIKSKNAVNVVSSIEESIKQIKKNTVIHDYSYVPVEHQNPKKLLGTIKFEDSLNWTDLKESNFLCIQMKTTLKWMKTKWKSQNVCLLTFFVFLTLLVSIWPLLVSIWPPLFALMILLFNSSKGELIPVCKRIANSCLQKSSQYNGQFCSILNYIIQSIRPWSCGDIKVKASGNIRCNITGLCFISSDSIAVVDKNNNSVKVIDITKLSVECEMSLGRAEENSPWDITKVGNTLATTLPYAETICFLQYDPSKDTNTALYCSRNMKVNGECRGIASSDEFLIISICDELSSVKIYDLGGNLLHSYCQDVSGSNLFSRPYYVAISPDQNTIYVSDGSKNHVTSLSVAGDVLGVFKHNELVNLFGVTVDKTGAVYVCGQNTIFKLTADLSGSQKLLDINNSMLNKVMYCNQRHCLYVAAWNKNILQVFALK